MANQKRTTDLIGCKKDIDFQLVFFPAFHLTIIGMINSEKIWTLIARKMAGEPLSEELIELEEWLNQDPELETFLGIIISSWQPGQYNKKEVQFAFRKVADKLAILNKQKGSKMKKAVDKKPFTDLFTKVKWLNLLFA